MPKASKEGGEPLICILCPSAKHFSDLSHLLTHLNSKGHLQSKHKLELRCATDQAAKDTLAAYMIWYSNNDFADALTERLEPKPKRRYVKAEKGVKKEKNVKPKTRKSSFIKPENEDSDEPHMSRVNSYGAPESSMVPHLKRSQSVNDAWLSNPYTTPRSTQSAASMNGSGTVEHTPVDPSLSFVSWRNLIPCARIEKKGKSGPLVLKGEIYDGMDVFDAATPRSKSKRNQRKGPHVMEQMMRNSASVEPNEVSFHASGERRRSRNVYELALDESGEEQDPIPSPRKKRKVDRKPLQDKAAHRLVKASKGEFLGPESDTIKLPQSEEAVVLKPSARAMLYESDYRPTAPFHVASGVVYNLPNQTVNPFNLVIQPDLQFGSPFVGFNHNDYVSSNPAGNPHLQSFKYEPLDKAPLSPAMDYERYRIQQSQVKVEAWTLQAQNPLITYQNGLSNSTDSVYGLADPFAQISQPSKVFAHDPLIAGAFSSRDTTGDTGIQSKGPKLGHFMPTLPWTTAPSSRSQSQVVPKTMTMSQMVGSLGGKYEEPQSMKYDPDTSVHRDIYEIGMLREKLIPANPQRDAQSNKTNLAASPVTVQRRSKRLELDHIEQEVLATPRYNLRQTPSSLRSTARSQRASLRRPQSVNKLHYSSDLESDLFDGGFKL